MFQTRLKRISQTKVISCWYDEKVTVIKSWQGRVHKFLKSQSFCEKLQIVCGVWTSRTLGFRMFFLWSTNLYYNFMLLPAGLLVKLFLLSTSAHELGEKGKSWLSIIYWNLKRWDNARINLSSWHSVRCQGRKLYNVFASFLTRYFMFLWTQIATTVTKNVLLQRLAKVTHVFLERIEKIS